MRFQKCLSDELTRKLASWGCSVHWMRSVVCVSKLVCWGEYEEAAFRYLAGKIKDVENKTTLIYCFFFYPGNEKCRVLQVFVNRTQAG